MPHRAFAGSFLFLTLLVLLVPCFFFIAWPTPSVANVQQDGAILYHVMPAEEPPLYCTTDIEDCLYMNMSTELVGLIEFQIFIDPLDHAYLGEPVTFLSGGLNWPDTWNLVDFVICRDGTGFVDPYGSSPHQVEMSWACEPVWEMFLAATLVFEVQEYGRLEFDGWGVSMWYGCEPDWYEVWPNTGLWAEAGAGCEYTEQPCRWRTGIRCGPRLQIDEMRLVTVPGDVAHGETHFQASQWFDQGCHGAFGVATGETWCSGYVIDGDDPYDNILLLDADAANLDVGVYETWVQVHAGGVARCLDLILEVQKPTAIVVASWGSLKRLFRN